MSWNDRITERRSLGMIGALFVVFLGFAALLFPGLTRLSFDLSFALRPTTPINEALIVYMGERSAVELGQPLDRQWDRSLHTRLVKQLTKASAKAVVFDLLFHAAGDPQVDQELANAMAANGRVVVAAGLSRVSGRGFTAANLILATDPIAHATGFGVTKMPLDNDGIVRKHCLSPDIYPSLSGKAAESVRVRSGRPAQQRWLNYYGPSGFIPYVVGFHWPFLIRGASVPASHTNT